jgi:predicted phosphodiesterase
VKRAFVFPDIHHPYHDEYLFATSLRMLRDTEPDVVIFIGDVFDCEQISKYHHNAYKSRIVQDAVKYCHEDIFSKVIEAAPQARFVFICGNHENRINTFFDTFLAPLGGSDFVSVRQLLKLDFVDEADFIPYMRCFELAPGTYLTHGHYVRSGSGTTVKKHMEYYPGNVLIGHTHRTGTHVQTQMNGAKRGYELGHMSKQPPGWTPHADWQSSPGTLVTYDDAGYLAVDIGEICGDVARVGGSRYKIRGA